MAAPRVAILVGLAEEAALVRRAAQGWPNPTPKIVIGGGTVDSLRESLPSVFGDTPDVVISLGYCGALAPDLQAGTLVIPEAVIGVDGQRYACAPAIAEAMRGRASEEGLTAVGGTLAGAGAAVATPADKAGLAQSSGAVAVDLESALLAQAAVDIGTRIAVVRAVLDDAGTALPAFAVAAVNPATGKPRIGRILAGLALKPGSLPDLIRLGRASGAAKASLRRLLVRPLPL